MNAGPGAPDVASAFETQQGMRTNDDAAPMIIKIQVCECFWHKQRIHFMLLFFLQPAVQESTRRRWL